MVVSAPVLLDKVCGPGQCPEGVPTYQRKDLGGSRNGEIGTQVPSSSLESSGSFGLGVRMIPCKDK
jgi:hypothetical protein